jgi:hypothetical protein
MQINPMKKIVLFILLILVFSGCSIAKQPVIKNISITATSSGENSAINLMALDDGGRDYNISSEWISLLNNLYVPSKYSDICESKSKSNCPAFSFENGKLPEKLQNNLHGEKSKDDGNAEVSLFISGTKAATIVINKKKIDIAVIPYNWTWASGGWGVYIVGIIDNRAEVIAKTDKDKLRPVINGIFDNKISISTPIYSDNNSNEIINSTCFFKNNELGDYFFQCNNTTYPIDTEFATSTDNKKVIFIRDTGDQKPSDDFADGIDNFNQIVLRDLDTGKEEIVLRSGNLADLKISNLPKDYPIIKMYTIRNLLLSYAGDEVYFEVPAWVTSDAIFSIDFKTKKLKFITDGSLVKIITEGEFMGDLVVNQRYIKEVNSGVQYCDYIFDAMSGKKLKDLKNCQ